MSLSKKTLIIIGILMLLFVLTLAVLVNMVVFNSYGQLEEKQVLRNVERAVNALTMEVDSIRTVNEDWAPWDDTYEYMMNGNEQYINGNLVDSIFIVHRFNFMLFLDTNSSVIYGKGYDYTNAIETPISDELLLHVTNPSFQEYQDEKDMVIGILMLSEGPVLLSSHPILTSEYVGPVAGYLIMGRYLSQVEMQKLSNTTKLQLSIDPIAESKIGLSIGHTPMSDEYYSIEYINESTVMGKGVLRDIYGNPSLKLIAHFDREIYQQGKVSYYYLIVSVLVTGLFFTIISVFLLKKFILSRVDNLISKLDEIRKSSDLSSRVVISGKDEISQLEKEFNHMMSALEKSHTIIKHKAYHDSLTDLPNRLQFYEQLQQLIKQAEVNNTMVAVMFIDLDNFKHINDTLGHDIGDQFLVMAAKALRNSLNDDVVVARIGGDEFTLILSNVTDKQDIIDVAERALTCLCTPFEVKDHTLVASASLGISVYPHDGGNVETLIKHADISMYRAKEKGGNRFEFYIAEMNGRAI